MIDETHDASLGSWVPGAADPGTDFPVQNLPLGVFHRPGEARTRIGVAIGAYVLDVAEAVARLLLEDRAGVLQATTLNALMAAGAAPRQALRLQLSRLLRGSGAAAEAARAAADSVLVPMTQAVPCLPAEIGDFTDFFASIHHATNAGRMFRPDNPLLPNYKYVPVAYHGRASSVLLSGTPVRRPNGQRKLSQEATPSFGPCRRLDVEVELGAFVGPGNPLGEPVSIGAAGERLFGYCLLNDWSARDIQAWEYQPLGPFLAKSFATTISPWVVTVEALAPFRAARYQRGAADPAPLPYLDDPRDALAGGFDIRLDFELASARMREHGLAPARLARSSTRHLYWTPAQMVAHHTSNGCNLRPGDLLGSGTVSGPTPESVGSLLELTQGGSQPITLPGGETRGFLEDGDDVILRGRCEREGFVGIGFGECRANVQPAPEAA